MTTLVTRQFGTKRIAWCKSQGKEGVVIAQLHGQSSAQGTTVGTSHFHIQSNHKSLIGEVCRVCEDNTQKVVQILPYSDLTNSTLFHYSKDNLRE